MNIMLFFINFMFLKISKENKNQNVFWVSVVKNSCTCNCNLELIKDKHIQNFHYRHPVFNPLVNSSKVIVRWTKIFILEIYCFTDYKNNILTVISFQDSLSMYRNFCWDNLITNDFTVFVRLLYTYTRMYRYIYSWRQINWRLIQCEYIKFRDPNTRHFLIGKS